MDSIYLTGQYLEMNASWHEEDSAWKADQVLQIIKRNNLICQTISELGCGAGGVIEALHQNMDSDNIIFRGYDISPQAIELATKKTKKNLTFYLDDLLAQNHSNSSDLLLVIDVFEHIRDYMGFLDQCKQKAHYKIYHIPLDIHVSSVLRNAFIKQRYTIGHLHYFTAESAFATLRDTQHEIIDFFYTNAAFGLFKQHPSFKRAIANVPRWLLSKISIPFTARLLGGYSLLVLTK